VARVGRIPGRQQPEPVAEAGQDLLRGQGTQPDRRQLDRQRDALQADAQIGHRLAVGRVDAEARKDRGAPLGEQPHRLELQELLRRPQVTAVRHRQGRHRDGHLTGDAEHLTARGQDAHARASTQNRASEHGAGVQQMLTVVQHQQRLPAGQVLRQRRHRPPGRLIQQAHSPRDLRGEQSRVAQARQFHQPDAIAERPSCLPRRPHRQARLPDSAWPAQGNQPGTAERRPDRGKLRPPPDEPAQLAAEPA